MSHDKDKRLTQLCDRGRFWNVEFDELSPAERVFRAIWELDGQVNNGGFDQYFFNSSGDTAFAVVEALEAIGAVRTAQIAGAANGVFPGESPPCDRAERQALLDAFDCDQTEFLEAMNAEFYGYPDNLMELLYDYVARHRADIAGASEIGF